MLADSQIRFYVKTGYIAVDPIPEDIQYQPASLDLKLGEGLDVWESQNALYPVKLGGCGYDLHPGAFALATTLETVTLAKSIAARVEGRSSLGRKGLLIHATAGFIDPGFTGQITLEMKNIGHEIVHLDLNMRICQLSFFHMDGPVERPYGHPDLKSKYQGQRGVTHSRLETEDDV